MTNGADDQLCGVESVSVAESAIDSGQSSSGDAGSDSSKSSLLSNQKSDLAGPTSEWDTYVDTQIRHDWVDLGHDERAFCDEYLENGYKHRDAAETIDRPPSSGIRILHKPLCREYIHLMEAKRRDRRIVSERFLDAQLSQLYDQATGEEAVPLVTGSGMELTAKKFNGQLALGIIQERAKLSGVAKPEIADTQVNVIIDMNALTGDNKVVSEQ